MIVAHSPIHSLIRCSLASFPYSTFIATDDYWSVFSLSSAFPSFPLPVFHYGRRGADTARWLHAHNTQIGTRGYECHQEMKITVKIANWNIMCFKGVITSGGKPDAGKVIIGQNFPCSSFKKCFWNTAGRGLVKLEQRLSRHVFPMLRSLIPSFWNVLLKSIFVYSIKSCPT